MIKRWHSLAALSVLSVFAVSCGQQDAGAPAATEDEARQAMIADALSAAPASITADATVVDWDGNVLREGTGSYTCLPTPPGFGDGVAPMCMDGPWMAWADAWSNRTDVAIDGIGISYMLGGDGGASNIDPFATEPTDDNEWIVEGPHLMVITPDTALLESLPTDPGSGGPYVMWKGTPYAHVMVPIDVRAIVEAESPLQDALAAINADMAASVTVVDWEGNTLQEGDGAYTCLPTPPQFPGGRAPMCMDGPWMTWADAWMNRTDLSIDGVGISYMLAGDEGASNIDPYASGPTDDNEWIVEGPHLMIIVPDHALLETLPTDPANGGPYVMWKGTPYAHIMVPLTD
jgi:hypothetical protein